MNVGYRALQAGMPVLIWVRGFMDGLTIHMQLREFMI